MDGNFYYGTNHHTENKDLASSHGSVQNSSACHLLCLKSKLEEDVFRCFSLNPRQWFTQSNIFRCLINATPHIVLYNASKHIQGSYPTISWIEQKKWIDVTIESLLIQRHNGIINLKDFILSHCSNSRVMFFICG